MMVGEWSSGNFMSFGRQKFCNGSLYQDRDTVDHPLREILYPASGIHLLGIYNYDQREKDTMKSSRLTGSYKFQTRPMGSHSLIL